MAMDGRKAAPSAQASRSQSAASEAGTRAGGRSSAASILWTVTAQEVLALIGRKWTVSILRVLQHGPRRFFQVRARIGGIQPKVLRENLRALERDGVLERVLHDDGAGSKGIAYELTQLGYSLLELLTTVHAWGDEHLDEVRACRRADSASRRTG
jgi:DNA-binding HxlR family transcriptional regulator